MRLDASRALVLVALCSCAAPDQEWRPASGPLTTRWGKAVTSGDVWPEYPRPQMARERWMNLNGPWEFAEAKEDEAPPCGRALAERILVPFPVESALSGVGRRAERVWYRRTFSVPRAWSGSDVLLNFGAVDWECRVIVNGKELLVHRGGYDPFSVDITPALARTGPQEIVLGVFDPGGAGDQPRGKQARKPEGIWYTPTTGVWQTVWLEPVSTVHVDSLRLDPDPRARRLAISVDAPRATPDVWVEAQVSAEGREIARARGRPTEALSIAVPEPRLWSPSDPFLYDVEVRLVRGAVVLDRVRGNFGMRTIEVAKDGRGVPRLFLNGAPLFQIGVLDQGFWPDGIYTAPSDEALRSDIELVKRLGFNLIRKHVKVEPERWYSWCDRLGVLVWQDMPSGFREGAAEGAEQGPEVRAQFRDELARMIEAHRNHPSIAMWVVFNEGWGQHQTRELAQFVKGLDPSRLVSNASGWTDERCGDVIDVHAYPGPAAPAVEAARAAVLGEFGGLGLGVHGHTWRSDTWGYRGVADSQELTDGYVNLLRRVHELREESGLSAAVYTQLTDVETECNGLVTYDREVVKVDAARAKDANEGRVPKLVAVVPTSRESGIAWRYRFDAPAASWTDPRFDDSSWQAGPGGFGTAGTPGAVVRTEWKTPEIWLRRTFALDAEPDAGLALLVHHDEDVEIFLNGVLAARASGYTTGYEPLSITPEGRATLVRGENAIAVHCRQTAGGQYVDVGISRSE
jgi:hypothetical protein